MAAFRIFLVLMTPVAAKVGVVSRLQGVLEDGMLCNHPACNDLSEPLNLSNMIERGVSAQKMRDASIVSPQIGNFTSYSGFFTTKKETHNNMFFWFFPPQVENPKAPLLIWLQGGPGGSSLFGMMVEMGPFRVLKDLTLAPMPSTWNKHYAMLFIDNPVGAGFSNTASSEGYVNNETEVADNLYSMLQQFYKVFPEDLNRDLYVTGESYGGHYVPAIAERIHSENEKGLSTTYMPLKGVAIGDGWIDPVVQMTGYPAQMFNLGLADAQQRAVIQTYCDQAVQFIKSGQMLKAFTVWDEMLNGDVFPYPNYFHNITGSNDYDNFMRTNPPANFEYYPKFLNLPTTRQSLHVGSTPYGVNASDCEHHLLRDFHASMVPRLQLDIIIGAPLTELFLPKVEWSGQTAYQTASRKIWRIHEKDPEVAGYVRQVKNFTQAIVRGAGHIVPADQPERAFDMINRFIKNIPY